MQLRTALSADRTVFAAERTYAAWLASLTASLMILFSGGCFVAAVWRELWPGVPPPNVRRIPVPLLLVVNGFLALVSLAALIGTWVVRIY